MRLDPRIPHSAVPILLIDRKEARESKPNLSLSTTAEYGGGQGQRHGIDQVVPAVIDDQRRKRSAR